MQGVEVYTTRSCTSCSIDMLLNAWHIDNVQYYIIVTQSRICPKAINHMCFQGFGLVGVLCH